MVDCTNETYRDPDHIHWTAAGNAVIAAEMRNIICRRAQRIGTAGVRVGGSAGVAAVLPLAKADVSAKREL